MITKTCNNCLISRSLDNFYKSTGGSRGREGLCKPCSSKRNKERYQKNKKHILDKVRQNTFGISGETYVVLCEQVNGVCEICKLLPKGKRNNLAVDHDATTGKFRGLLCNNCNAAIGLFNHDPLVLEKAIEYLNTSARERYGPKRIATDNPGRN